MSSRHFGTDSGMSWSAYHPTILSLEKYAVKIFSWTQLQGLSA